MIDLAALGDAVQAHARVVRIVIAAHRGSTPRESGTSMLVFAGGSQGTIGGGRLELEAVRRAQGLLEGGPVSEVRRQALGPALGQCCGGAVTLVSEVWDAARYADAFDGGIEIAGVFARRVEGEADLPDRVRRRLASGGKVTTQLADGWLIEQLWRAQQPVYIYGAGHVGAALAAVLAPMPQFEVHVVDARAELLAALPKAVQRHAGAAHKAMAGAAPDAAHFIMTPEHEFDLDLCHRLLGQRFGYGGLIGSATKWARFRKRLAALGHGKAAIDQIECPIGDPALGKHPQAIAVGVAARLLARRNVAASREDVA